MSIKIEKTENNNELKLEFTIEAKKFDEALIKVQSTLIYQALEKVKHHLILLRECMETKYSMRMLLTN